MRSDKAHLNHEPRSFKSLYLTPKGIRGTRYHQNIDLVKPIKGTTMEIIGRAAMAKHFVVESGGSRPFPLQQHGTRRARGCLIKKPGPAMPWRNVPA